METYRSVLSQTCLILLKKKNTCKSSIFHKKKLKIRNDITDTNKPISNRHKSHLAKSTETIVGIMISSVFKIFWEVPVRERM